MKNTDQIIKEMAGEPFSLKSFLRNNVRGILVSLIFHMLLLIAFLLIRIDTFRQTNEMGVVLDFTYEMQDEDKYSELSPEEAEKIAMYERLLETALRTVNQPQNVSEHLKEKISTENFVDEVERQLNETRSEEQRKRLEEMKELLAEGVIVPEKQEDDLQHIPDIQGPTRISYEFLEPPYDRYANYMPVPIYKCQGDGVVEVEITVGLSGNVITAKPIVIGSPSDAQCLAEAAVHYAKLTVFYRSTDAPQKHKGKIRYSFVKQ